jgi:hypothetical protein
MGTTFSQKEDPPSPLTFLDVRNQLIAKLQKDAESKSTGETLSQTTTLMDSLVNEHAGGNEYMLPKINVANIIVYKQIYERILETDDSDIVSILEPMVFGT